MFENKFRNQANKIQESIELISGPLMKVGLFQTQKGSQILIAIHHLVIDGISWRILLEDIEILLKNYRQ